MDAPTVLPTPAAPQQPKLLDLLRQRIRVLHYSIRTEQAYVDWARRFILFHGKRHPRDMGAPEVMAFLTHLAVERNVAASTQNQAKAAILFLYKEVLQQDLPWLDEVVSAKKARRLPVVLTQREVRELLLQLQGTQWLVASLLYGTGMRILEALRLRVKDVEFERRELVVRQGKGNKDRVTVLPENLIAPLREQMERARVLHAKDLDAGLGAVWLPDALEVKYPNAAKAWGWQYVFPSAVRSVARVPVTITASRSVAPAGAVWAWAGRASASTMAAPSGARAGWDMRVSWGEGGGGIKSIAILR